MLRGLPVSAEVIYIGPSQRWHGYKFMKVSNQKRSMEVRLNGHVRRLRYENLTCEEIEDHMALAHVMEHGHNRPF